MHARIYMIITGGELWTSGELYYERCDVGTLSQIDGIFRTGAQTKKTIIEADVNPVMILFSSSR